MACKPPCGPAFLVGLGEHKEICSSSGQKASV